MRPVVLSRRLRAVAKMVTRGNRVCDVGCDHGFVPIWLVQQGISPGVLAMDLREGPLRAAEEHVAAHGLSGQIETRLSDGLHNYNIGEADTLICAGMGGGLMLRILAAERDKTVSFRELILQPQSEMESFRRFLREGGYDILDEEMLIDEGKYYQVIRAVPGGKDGAGKEAQAEAGARDEELCKLEDRYGPLLLRKKTPVFLSYLEREAALYEEILENLRAQGLSDDKRRARHEQVEALLEDNIRAKQVSFV